MPKIDKEKAEQALKESADNKVIKLTNTGKLKKKKGCCWYMLALSLLWFSLTQIKLRQYLINNKAIYLFSDASFFKWPKQVIKQLYDFMIRNQSNSLSMLKGIYKIPYCELWTVKFIIFNYILINLLIIKWYTKISQIN